MRDAVNALLFLWATLGTGALDLAFVIAGGYEASITATVRGWYGPCPWLRFVIAGGFGWLTWHFGIEDLIGG